MTITAHLQTRSLLILIAGAKGAIGSTLAVAAHALQSDATAVADRLTTGRRFAELLPLDTVYVAGWDIRPEAMTEAIRKNGVLPEARYRPHAAALDRMPVASPSSGEPNPSLSDTADRLSADIAAFRSAHPGCLPVLVNLLPACAGTDSDPSRHLDRFMADTPFDRFPDMAYALAAVRAGIPVVNFTPNEIELAPVVEQAVAAGTPMCGRDGKTGQTYFKVVLASALQARGLYVDGWYSTNILGNADGRNLMDPAHARCKLANKTDLLDELLGYRVGERYGASSHRVHIDFYPPRGDAKEAWDVIDFLGLFDMPMSLRVDLQGRDSILAAPMAIDLARWMAVLQMAGRRGPVSELAFYFKKPAGDRPPVSFVEQVTALERLEQECLASLA